MLRDAEKDNSKYVKKDYKKKFKKLNLLQAKAAHQKSKYEKLNKYFTKSKTSKEEMVNIADSSDRKSSSRSESNNFYPKTGKKKSSITYDSDSDDDGEISSSSTSSKDSNWIDSFRDTFIRDKSTTNSKSKLKEHKLSSNNLDTALQDSYLLNTLRKPTNKKDKQSKSSKKLKHVLLIPIIFVKLIIQEGKKDRQSKTRLVKSLVNSWASNSIFTKEKSEKLPVKKTKHEQQWSTATGVLITNTKTATSFSFHEINANKLTNQSLHVVNLNINRYDMIIGCDLINSLGIDIHDADMTIQWDDTTIPWRDIDSTINNVFALSQYNALFNSETKRMKRILDAKYPKADLKTIA